MSFWQFWSLHAEWRRENEHCECLTRSLVDHLHEEEDEVERKNACLTGETRTFHRDEATKFRRRLPLLRWDAAFLIQQTFSPDNHDDNHIGHRHDDQRKKIKWNEEEINVSLDQSETWLEERNDRPTDLPILHSRRIATDRHAANQFDVAQIQLSRGEDHRDEPRRCNTTARFDDDENAMKIVTGD